MKKFLLSLSLLCAAAPAYSSHQSTSAILNVSIACKVVKKHVGSQNKAYYLKSSISLLAFGTFVYLSYRGCKKVYNRFRKKGTVEKVVNSFFKQPSYLSYTKYIVIYALACVILCFAGIDAKKQCIEMYKTYNEQKENNTNIVFNDNEQESV